MTREPPIVDWGAVGLPKTTIDAIKDFIRQSKGKGIRTYVSINEFCRAAIEEKLRRELGLKEKHEQRTQ